MKYNRIFDDQIKSIIENHKFTAGKILKSKNNKHLLEYILDNSCFLPKNTNTISRALFVVNHKDCTIKCKECGKDLKKSKYKI